MSSAVHARRGLMEALRDAPDDAYLLYQLGATQKTLGDPAAASSLERSLALDSCGAVKALSPDAEADAWMRLAPPAPARKPHAIALGHPRPRPAIKTANVPAPQTPGVACGTVGPLAQGA